MLWPNFEVGASPEAIAPEIIRCYILSLAYSGSLRCKILSSWAMEAPTPEVVTALQQLRAQPRWKPDRDLAHLRKRQRRGHLAADATIDTYNQLIRNLVHTPSSLVYRYPVAGRTYYAVRGLVFEQEWLVIFDRYGVLETAFPPNDMDAYIHTQGFAYVGTVEEVLS